MAIKLHNTLAGKLEEFSPINPGEIKMFVCGPTVYDYSHLGHAKTYTQFDFIARFFRYSGFKLTYLQNITDIDDKIIQRAHDRSMEPQVLAEEFEKYYKEDMRALNNTSTDKYAGAHEYIPQIVDQIKRLLTENVAYKISDGYYFDITRFDDYGKLSGRSSLKPDDSVSRIDENPEKRNPGDFCLWKFRKENEPYWPTELGEGRPGWHIEDTAITEHELGPQYDIHGGAIDLIFPHHEAEIAQMETASGLKPMVRYWLHTGFLNIDSKKMSKSLGNFMTIRDILALGVLPGTLRYFFFGSHYRSPIDFNSESLEAAGNAYKKLKVFYHSLIRENGRISKEYKKEFSEAMENDMNTPEALAVVWKLLKDESISSADKRITLLDFDRVLGLDLEHNEFEVKDFPKDVEELLEKRRKARIEENWEEADKIRKEIENKGFMIKDGENTQTLFKL